MNKRPIITLLTDFGTTDTYVSVMKGVILSICSEVTIIDISHAVNKFDVRHGAFLLSQATPYFPENTIHTAVVDPGVGKFRRRIIVKGNRCYYVGPDNGVLSLAIKQEGFIKAVEIKEKHFLLPDPSSTFEGRDVFAPVSAHLAAGVNIDEFGPELSNIVTPSFSRPIIKKDKIIGEVLHVDEFGNLITNIQESFSEAFDAVERSLFKVKIDKVCKIIKFSRTYGDVPVSTPTLLYGSSKFLEISVNKGSAKKFFKAHVGCKTVIEKES